MCPTPASATSESGGHRPDEQRLTTDHGQLPTEWHRVADLDELDEGRVKTVIAGHRSVALTHCGGRYGALDNHCPHQGGPLGEGSIEKGWLRCPWHGYDYDPQDGTPPPGFTDAPESFPVEVRDDGVYVEIRAQAPHVRTVSDVMAETLVAWGVTHVFGMVGHSNLGFADALRRQEALGNLRFIGIRHEGAAAFAASAYGKLTGRPAACFAIAGPGSTNLLTGLYDAKVDRSPVLAISGQVPSKVLGRGAFQDVDLTAAFADVAGYSRTVLPGSDHAELTTLALKHAVVEREVAHLVLPDEVQVLPAPDERGFVADRPGARRHDLARPRPRSSGRWRCSPGPPGPSSSSATAPASTCRPCWRSPRRSVRRCSRRSRPRARCPTTTRSVPACSVAAGRRWPAG